ncbi:hypothetical protein IWQ62_002893 [Dispira parvispora]|uniref:F-box domain-containing protein n=1 Tax=Dispira parvispora TaxID=1520584 RepID=A0A9W8ARW7_9FUNG|nr:hypothetical protein IWQ62_002893 [Dispira parvispora]
MGELWDLVCVDNRQATRRMQKLSEIFPYCEGIPDILEYVLTVSGLAYPPWDHPPKLRLIFDRLPDEILGKICSYFPTIKDGRNFALASDTLFKRCEKFVVKKMSWVGKRIICLGENAEDGPPGFFRSEQEEMEILSKRLYDLVESYETLDDEDFACPLLNQQCVLRNLSTKEYICQSSSPYTLGHLLLTRICWSYGPDLPADYEAAEVLRGVWAGHRFDMVAESTFDKDGWTDVTQAVVGELREVFEADSEELYYEVGYRDYYGIF